MRREFAGGGWLPRHGDRRLVIPLRPERAAAVNGAASALTVLDDRSAAGVPRRAPKSDDLCEESRPDS